MRFALPFLLLLPLAASAATVADLQGDWVVDVDETWKQFASAPQFKQMKPEQLEQMKPMMMTQLGKMTWKIAGDTATVVDPTGAKKTSTWKAAGSDGDTLTIASTDEKGVARQGTIQFLPSGRLIARGFADQAQQQPTPGVVMKRPE